jgi:hypothetical protein
VFTSHEFDDADHGAVSVFKEDRRCWPIAPFGERAAALLHRMGMKRAIALAVALLAALAACGEKPQRLIKEPQSATAPDESDLRERALRQGESGRIAY